MSQFDETTKRKAEAMMVRPMISNCEVNFFIDGRDSVKKSLKILAEALEHYVGPEGVTSAMEAIDLVKSRGDWPID